MKKSLCMILAAVMGISMLPMTAMAMEEAPYAAEAVENTDPEEWLDIETQEETELTQEEEELEEEEEETEQLVIVEEDVQYYPFSLNLGAKANLNLFEEAPEGDYFLDEYAVYNDALKYTIQGDEEAERYIDRITLPAFAEDFYDALEEAVDGDGRSDFLMDPSYYSFGINKDGFKVLQDSDEVNRIVYEVVKDIKLKSDKDISTAAQEINKAASRAYTAFDRDHPEVFWLNNELGFMTSLYYTYMKDGNGNIVEGSVTYYLNFYFSIANDEYGTFNQIRSNEFLDENGEYFSIRGETFYGLDDVAEYPYQLAEQIIESFDASEDDHAYDGTGPAFRDEYDISTGVTFDDLTDAGKVAYFDFWLTRNAEYNDDVANGYETTLSSPYECVSALWAEGGPQGPVCEGYARALKLLCEMENIDCVLVSGDSSPSLGRFDGKEDHMWNYVEVDGEWYAQDTTWNDPTNADPWTRYLLVGSETIEVDHHWMNQGFNKVMIAEGPEIETDDFPRVGNWMVKDAVEASVEEDSVELKIYPTRFDVTEAAAKDDIVMLVATLYDQAENRLLDVKTKVCTFGELDAWTAELSAGENTDLGYKVFLINTKNHGPIMKQIEENL